MIICQFLDFVHFTNTNIFFLQKSKLYSGGEKLFKCAIRQKVFTLMKSIFRENSSSCPALNIDNRPYSPSLAVPRSFSPMSGIQGYQDTGIPGYRDTRIQGFQDTGIPGYRDTRIHGISGYRDTWIQVYRGFQDTGTIQGVL